MTQVGSAHVAITASTAQAAKTIQTFLGQTKNILKPLAEIKPSVNTSAAQSEITRLVGSLNSALGSVTIKPKLKTADLIREIKTALASASAEIALKVKPITQGQVNAALSGITATKEITVDIKGDAATKLKTIRDYLKEIKSLSGQAITADTTAVTALVVQLTSQITQLNAIEAKLRGLSNRPPLGGGSSGSGSGGGTGGGSSGGRQGQGLSTNTSQLIAQLDQVNNAYKRGDVSAEFYARRLTQLQTQLKLAAQSAQVGSRDFTALDRAVTNTAQGMNRIQADKITKIRTELAGARQAFDAAAAGATNLAQRRAAIAAYEADLTNIRAKLTALGSSANLTAGQLGSVNRMLAQTAREGNTIRGGINIAGLSGNVLNSLRGLPGLLGSLGGPLAGVAGQAAALGGGLSGIAALGGPVGVALGGIALAAAGLATGLKASIDTAANFEQKLANIRALTETTAPVLEQLKQATFDIGKPLGVGANEAAGAILELNKAGLSTAETLGGGLKGTLELAGAAGLKAAEAATLATSAMTAFGLSGKDLPRVADIFANFANKTFLGAQDLSQAIAAVGPVARSSGLDMAQFSGIMATLAQGGFKNMSDAGTSLKTMLLSLQAPSENGAKYLKAIGVNVFDSAGKLKPFNQTINDLREKLVKLTPEAQKQVMKQIFGTDAVRAAEILLNKGPKAIDANAAAMKKQGEAARVAKERLESLQGASARFGAIMEEVKIKIGSPFLGALTGIVNGATKVVQSFLDLNLKAGSTGVAFGQMGASAKQALSALSGIVKTVFGAISATYDTVLKPVLAVLGQVWGVIQTAVTTALTIVLNVINGVFKAATGIFSGFVGSFTTGSNGVKTNLGGMATGFKNWAELARGYLVAVGQVAGDLPRVFGEMGKGLGRIFAGISKIFSGFALMAYDYLVKPVLPVIKVVGDAFTRVGTTIGNGIVTLINWVGQKLGPLIEVMKGLGIGIAEALGRALTGVANGIKGLVSNAAGAVEERAQTEAAAAAERGAKATSTGMGLIKEGIGDVGGGFNDLKATVTEFGASASKTFGQVEDNVKKARAEVDKLNQTLSKPVAAPAPADQRLGSGAVSRSQIDALADGDKGKKKGQTVEQVNALEAYRQKLKQLNVEELKAEIALQTRLKDVARLKLATTAYNAAVAAQARETAKATKEQAAASKKEALGEARANAAREKLVSDTRKAIANLNAIAQAGKGTAKDFQTYSQRFDDLAARANKLPEAQKKGLQPLFDQAGALLGAVRSQGQLTAAQEKSANAVRNSGIGLQDFTKALRAASAERLKELEAETRALKQTAAHGAVVAELTRRKNALAAADKAAAKEAEKERQTRAGQEKEAGRLSTQLNNLNQGFQLQLQTGKVTAGSLLTYQQRLAGIGEGIKALPADLQAGLQGALASAAGYEAAGQRAAAYSTEIAKLKESVKEWTYEELLAAKARVEAAGGDAKKLEIINAQIAKFKTLSDATLAQAQAEGVLSQAQATVKNTEATYSLDTAAAEGNLAKLYALELQYGAKLQGQRDAVARAEAASNEVAIRDKYSKLGKLAGLSAQQLIDLDKALNAELQANSDALTAGLAANAAKRSEGEAKAKRDLDAEILRVDRDTRRTLEQQALQAIQTAVKDEEAALAEELSAEDLTANEKYQIRLKHQTKLIALKQKEVERQRQIEEKAEEDRYADAIANAEKLGTADQLIAGTNQTVRQRLEQEHNAVVEGIRKATADAARDYELAVKRDTGKALVAAEKETSASRLEAANKVITDQIEGLDTMTAAQRKAAAETLAAWVEVYKKMPGADLSSAAIAALEQAVEKIKGVSTKAVADFSKLIVADPKTTTTSAAADLTKLAGKPDDRGEAEAAAVAKFDNLISGYKAKIAEIQEALKSFEGVPPEKLTPDEAKLLAGLNASLALYKGFEKDATAAAALAGQNAGQAFSSANADKMQEGKEALIDAQHEQAQAEGRDDSAAYLAGLNASLAYWRARKGALVEGSDEYLAALKKVIALEGKIRAETPQTSLQGLGGQFKAGQAEGVKQFNAALGGMAKGMGNALSPMAIFAAILERINPAGMILEGMFSVLEEPIKALQEPFKTIGTLLGSVLAPVLELIAPILELLAQLFVALYDALAELVKSISFGLINIDRRDPSASKNKDDKALTPAEKAAKEKEYRDAETEAELLELDNKLAKKEITEEEYYKRKLGIALKSIEDERTAAIAAAEGDERKILAINRKYDALKEKEQLDSIARVTEKTMAAYRQIGESAMSSITGSISGGLMAALKAGNFGVFRQSFAANLKSAMFEAVLNAAIETAAFKAILQPAIDALTTAFASGNKGDIDKAINGVIAAGNQVLTKSKEIYNRLRPLRDAWNIRDESSASTSQNVTVTGSLTAPEMKVSLDMLAYLAETIKVVLPDLRATLQALTPVISAETDALKPHTVALKASTAALPTFTQDVSSFHVDTQTNKDTATRFDATVTRMGEIISGWGQASATHAAAMLGHAQSLATAPAPSATNNNGGGFAPKR